LTAIRAKDFDTYTLTTNAGQVHESAVFTIPFGIVSMQATGMPTQGGAQQFYIFNVFVLLIIACSIVCCILITSQEKKSDSSRKNPIFHLKKLR
jgi:hypothetical protein